AVMSAGLCWLLWPASFHQIAEGGCESERVETLTTRVLDWALLPFVIGLGLALYATATAMHTPFAWAIALLTSLFAALAWYGGTFAGRGNKKAKKPPEEKSNDKADLSGRIKKVLIECRMGLPGAQAFLGFQFAIVFTDAFDRL